MMGHPYAQGWRAIMRAEAKRKARRAWLSAAMTATVGVGAVAGAVGVVINWPW